MTLPTTRNVRLKASTQVGKTLALLAVVLYLAETAPASAMAVLPDQAAAIEFRDRLYALAIESGLTVPPRWRWNTRHCDVGAMRLYLAWPTSASRMRSRRCKYIFRSEIDVYQSRGVKDDPLEATNQRVKAYLRHLIVDESSPLPDPSRISKLEADSHQRRWWGRCPHCGTYQEVRFFTHKEGPHAGRCGFGGLHDPHGNLYSPADVRHHAHYICQTGCLIQEPERSEFVRNGRWVPRGCRVNKRGQLLGHAERDSQREIGFHLWAIHSHNFGDIAAEYIRAKVNGVLPDFFQNWLGLSWQLRGKMPTWQELGSRLAGQHRRGTVPSWVWFLTAGVDVQDDEVYVTVRGWGDQRTSCLIDWWLLEREPGDDGDLVKSDLGQINEAILSRVFPLSTPHATNPRGRAQLGVALLAIDGNHRTMDVHEWRRSLDERTRKRTRIVRGETQIKADQKYRMNVLEHSKRDATVVYEGGLEMWNVNVDVFKTDLAQRFRAAPDKPGAWFVTSDCLEQGQFYLKQVVNEPQVLVRGKDGRWKAQWRERDSTTGHDYWDCEVYASVAAQMIVDGFPDAPGWEADKWPTGQEQKKKRGGGRRVDEIGVR